MPKTVAQLLQRGASYIDTRTEAEFKAGHVPGARLVPYVEKSAKDADFDREAGPVRPGQTAGRRAAPS